MRKIVCSDMVCKVMYLQGAAENLFVFRYKAVVASRAGSWRMCASGVRENEGEKGCECKVYTTV